jgi:cytoskeleton protein RodZ
LFATQRKRETDLPSFGEKLKQERVKRKITLEQISVSTKIGTRMLQALEEDKFSQLPGGIFNKGFVRAYSRCLGLDEDQTVAEYLEASGDAPPPRTEIAVREDEARENEEHVRRLESGADGPFRRVPWGWFAAALLLIALALSVWTRQQRERARQDFHPVPATTAASSPPPQLSNDASGKTADPNPAVAGPSAPSPVAADAGGSAASNPQTPDSRPPDSRLKDSASTTVIPGEFTVTIHARDESWVSITVDGKAISSEVVAAGSERSVRGQKEVVVKAGNAGGVDFQFNGKKVDTGAKYGEVKTVIFGPTGMITSAPPPSTP